MEVGHRKGAFTREATGLVREISFWGAFGHASASLSVITGWFLFQWFGPAVPGGELGVATLVGMCFTLVPALVYAMLSAAMPRSGGDYVFISRILTPEIGFMANFFVGFYFLTAIGWNVTTATAPSIVAVLAVYGRVYNNPAVLGWASALTNLNMIVLLSLGIIIVLTLLALLNVGRLFRIIFGLLVLSYISIFLQLSFLSVTSPGDFAKTFNDFSGYPNLYQTVISNASELGLQPTWTIGATLGPALLFSFMLLGGYQYPSFMSGEIKRPQKTAPLAILAALVVNGLLYATYFEFVYKAFGYDFVSAVGFSGANPSSTPLIVPFFVSVLVRDNPAALFLISLGLVAGALVLPLTIYPSGTRLMFAWAFDRILPTRIAEVNDRFRSPVNATIVAGLLFGVFFLFIWNYTGFVTYYANMIMGYVIATAILMITAIAFPFRRRDIFEAAPSFSKKKIAGFPAISIIGVVGLVIFIWILYGTVTNPAIGGPISYGSMGFMISVFLVALIIYYISLYYNRSKGIDIRLAFKEIPPE